MGWWPHLSSTANAATSTGFNAESGRYTISLFEPVGDRCELLVKEINLSK